MSLLENKIDFVAFVSATMANANGDPLNGNRPRIDYNSFGEISDVCIKRKLRNRMQDLGCPIFVQSDDRRTDGYKSLSERAKASLEKVKDPQEYARLACESWLDVRSFGQVFAFEKAKDAGVSIGIRGPVSIHQAASVSPIEVHSIQITKSVSGKTSETRGSDTMGMKHMVRFGLYKIKGSINVQLAQKTGLTLDDTKIIKECLRTLFENDASSARPEGSMQVVKLYWWEHNCPSGQYPSAWVHQSVAAKLKTEVHAPTSIDDYDEFLVEELPDLRMEIINGI